MPRPSRCLADVLRLSDEQVAHTIRQDQIDILVDLTMHMANNRLLVFARKPAPVQVTYLAYCGTTGLSTMDYRLTDPYLDPPGRDERFYSGAVGPLAGDVLVLSAADRDSAGQCPARRGGGACQLRLAEQLLQSTSPALAAWSRLLQACPDRGCSCMPAPAAIATGCGLFWPSKASRRSGWYLSTSCPGGILRRLPADRRGPGPIPLRRRHDDL